MDGASGLTMASSSVGDRQLQRIIKDLHDAVIELCKEHRDCGEPITDDCANLHKFFYKLEYLLQFDQKEKTTFLGQRKDYWDYFCECLMKIKGHNDVIRFVKSIPELKTSLGKGRAFIRYSLVHQRLADTLQQCLINQKVTSDWYYARSPFLKPHLTADIINHLYELNQIQFDVAARGYDLDADWPVFARRTLGTCSPAYLWKPPSRCSSINSLSSSFSHTQAQEIQVPDLNHSLLGELGELAEPASCSAEENLRLELDQSELRQQELLVQVEGLGREAAELKGVIKDLQEQLSAGRMQETCNQERVNHHQSRWDSTVTDLRDRLAAAEDKNMELLLKLDEALKEKEQQAVSYCDSAWKTQELLEKLRTSEEERSKRDAEDRTEQLSQQLKVREEELKKSQEELADVRAGARSEREEALVRLEELQSAVGRIQGALTLREKETGNLRAQLQDLQASLERRERQAEDLKKRLQEERHEEQQRCFLSQSEEVLDLQKALRSREKEVASSSERIKHLEEQLEKSNVVRDENTDYESLCGKMREENQQLLQEVRRSEGSITQLTEARAVLLDQLAALKASQNQLQSRVEAANMSVEDREKVLLEENLHLEEAVQKLLLQKEESERRGKRLDQENEELLHSQSSLKQEVDLLHTKAEKLEKELTVAQRRQAELLEELQETEVKLEEQTVRCGLLQAQELERRNGEKGAAESNKELDHQTSSQEAQMKLVLAEAQLELHQKEVLRLQEEVVELRAQLLAGNEERVKLQALQEVTETSREDLRVLADQLKAQVEELNRRHVDEMLRSREREEALMQERDAEARAGAGLVAELTSSREQLEKLKQRCEALGLENMDYQEALHRANTETAELGVHVCMLTADSQESSRRWEGLTTELQRLEEDAALKTDGLNQHIEELRQENRELQRQIQNRDELLQTERSEAQRGAEAELQSRAETHEKHLQEVKLQLAAEQEEVGLLQNKLQQLEAENRRCNQQMEQKNLQMAETANLLLQREDEIARLNENLSRSEESLAAAQQTCQEMAENLRMLKQDKQSLDLRTAAELDDLYRTKINLEERLVELIREKDVLWQKSDALEFEQKLRDEQTERDVNHCLGCHTQFSWWLRKYNCRLCGRPFCYYCCSNTVSTQQGGSREHCCVDCYNLHSAVVERHPQEEVAHGAPGTLSRLLQAGRAVTGIAGGDGEKRQDDAVFDIITEEEVSGVYEGGSPSGCSPDHDQEGAAQLSSAAADGASEDPEDVGAAVQDAEICLLKSGELTLSTAFTVDDISGFGESSRELFIKSSCYSVISVSMSAAGPTVCWTFTSEPKSISFSVVYRENAETPLEQAKVLIPLTRCNSHKETIQGELKVRNPGEYTLIFDNSFSRFISKRIRYHLTLDKPVIYDGTDLL
ncbi:FYVE and coiled-coil domain-containing protein 1 isoform X2 [Oryzias melastigma]|uniref:FYVE and coiled-coil domain-containing protein 1 isoform X2 n=1 Tax=Oryzias melastigma TaxID=30732 RepID=UPI000CF82A37|nr:FYVE and coiled-coil domain-containing protein 1 isoform X2 [Oryzias melastigma]